MSSYGMVPGQSFDDAIQAALVRRIARNVEDDKDRLEARVGKAAVLRAMIQDHALELRVALAEAKEKHGNNADLALGIDSIIASGEELNSALNKALIRTVS